MKHIEITTILPCPNQCNYCPQDKISYSGKLSLEDFKKALKNIPIDVSLHFSGFSEPFANPEAHEMIKLADKLGYDIQVYTTTLGLREEELKDVKFSVFCIHRISPITPRIAYSTGRMRVTNPISRAGNLYPTPRKDGKLICRKDKGFEQNVMLPNGDVYLCCMDYSLKHKLGNIFKTKFDDLKRQTTYELCRYCEYSELIN